MGVRVRKLPGEVILKFILKGKVEVNPANGILEGKSERYSWKGENCEEKC